MIIIFLKNINKKWNNMEPMNNVMKINAAGEI